jgi:hypothetical protein
MRFAVNLLRRLDAIVGLGLLSITIYVIGQQAVPAKQSREIQMFIIQQDGSLTAISRETAAIDYENFGVGLGNNANSRNTVATVKLPGDRAKIRDPDGQDVRIIALLPHSFDPRQLELQSFEIRGKMRVAYLDRFGQVSGSNWNTHSFHAQQQTDGSWLLEPSRLAPGEYCFSPKFNNDNFCFGVDRK